MAEVDYTNFLFGLMEDMQNKYRSCTFGYKDIIEHITDQYNGYVYDGTMMENVLDLIHHNNFTYNATETTRYISGEIKYVLDVFALYMMICNYRFNMNYRYHYVDDKTITTLHGNVVIRRTKLVSDITTPELEKFGKNPMFWIKDINPKLLTDGNMLYIPIIYSEAGTIVNPNMSAHVLGIGHKIDIREEVVDGVIKESLTSVLTIRDEPVKAFGVE